MEYIKKIFNTIEKQLKNSNNTYIVGGFIRDVLLKRKTNDIDIVIENNIENFSKKIADKLHGSWVVLDMKRNIFRVVVNKYNIDFTKLYYRNIYRDLLRRDFTINAIALKLNDWKCIFNIENNLDKLIDPLNGINDLNKKIIKTVKNDIFIKDPLRLLRAYRISAELDFYIDNKTQKLIKKYSYLITLSAKERVSYELFRIFNTQNAGFIIEDIEKNNILSYLIPEIKQIKRSPYKYYFHPKGLWQHSVESLKSLEYILNNLKKLFNNYEKKIIENIKNRIPLLKFITLLHDISKPQTVKIIDNRPRFFNHEIEGSKKIKNIFKRLKFSNNSVRIAEKLVFNHMRPGNLSQLKKITDRAIYRFLRDIDNETIDLLLLSLADRHSYIKETGRTEDYNVHKKFVYNMIKKIFQQKEKNKKLPKIIDGNIVMKYFNLTPGPLIGKILEFVKENQITGKINTTEQAISLIKEKFLKT